MHAARSSSSGARTTEDQRKADAPQHRC
jgi:hypothetical protein